ncbi:MAG TPA: enterochelin esterase, partial [Patescibacteria group bacterium]|nr:enterochelin esterase [Patescibacteria group bacterium]
MRPWSRPFRGRLDELTIDSAALRGNPLGDPSVRPIWVYLPPGYDDAPSRRYPTIYLI